MTLYDRMTAGLTWAEHAALALLRGAALAETSVHTLEATSPEIASAIAAGKAIAEAHGVPVESIEDVVLRLAKEFASGPAPGNQAAA